MSRILLINPPKEVPLLDWTMRYPPLGLMALAASLDGHEVEILDMKVQPLKKGELARKLAAADIVGVTVLTPSIDSALEICREAKQQGAVTVAGGVHPSLMPQVVENPEIDIVVRGEGELSFREIADGKPLGSIAGISYVWGGKAVHNPDRPPADLGSLPPPRRDLVAKYLRSYNSFGKSLNALSTARGCPYRCSFCCVPRLWHGYRELSPDQVVAELERLQRTEVVSIVDDNFCHDMKRVEAICDLIVQKGLNDRIYSVFSRVDSIVRHPEVVRKMSLAGMKVVFIGIEAASQEALDRMNKKTHIEDIYRACEILDENGILIWAGNIVGNLDDTYEDVEALIRMSAELPIDIADFTVITPYPGTELFEQASREGLIDEYDFAEYCECEPHMHSRNLSRAEIMELQIKAYWAFYGVRALLKRTNRWSRDRSKRWIVEGNLAGMRSFWKFRNRSARYFWRTYKETVGKTEGTKIRRFSPMVSTPKLYSLGAGIGAALVTLLGTALLVRYYGQYSSRPRAFVVADLLFASVVVAFVTAMVATWLAVRSYRRGWIFSVRQRKATRSRSTILERSVVNGLIYAGVALLMTAVFLAAFALSGRASQLSYGMKEVLVSVIAFMSALVASYGSIISTRNGVFAADLPRSRQEK